MGAIANTVLSASIYTSSLENTNLLLSKKQNAAMKSSCGVVVVSRNSSKMSRVSCKLSESGIEEKPTSIGVSNTENRMEDYNTAMKRMMRNPYEYHHDLGRFLSHLPKLALCCSITFHFCREFSYFFYRDSEFDLLDQIGKKDKWFLLSCS